MATLKGKTSSTLRIRENKNLALWRDITQTKTRRYPKELYDRVIPFMQNNYIFKPGDIDLVEKRYGQGMEFLDIGSAARGKILRILRDLNINRKGYVEGEFLTTKDKTNHNFEKGYWNGRKISEMSTYYLEKAREYAIRTNQSMKAAELDRELKLRKGVKTLKKTISKPLSIIEYSKQNGVNYEAAKQYIQMHKDIFKDKIVKVGRCKYLNEEAQEILNNHFHKDISKLFTEKKPVKKVKKQDDDYMLKARLKLAFLMAKEENEEVKNEYFNLLKDLRKGE